MVNKVTFAGFRGTIAPPGYAPGRHGHWTCWNVCIGNINFRSAADPIVFPFSTCFVAYRLGKFFQNWRLMWTSVLSRISNLRELLNAWIFFASDKVNSKWSINNHSDNAPHWTSVLGQAILISWSLTNVCLIWKFKATASRKQFPTMLSGKFLLSATCWTDSTITGEFHSWANAGGVQGGGDWGDCPL